MRIITSFEFAHQRITHVQSLFRELAALCCAMALKSEEINALKLIAAAYIQSGVPVVLQGHQGQGDPSFWRTYTETYLFFFPRTYMVNAIQTHREAVQQSERGELKIRADTLQCLVNGFLSKLQQEEPDRWTGLPVAVAAEEFRTWLVGGPGLQSGCLPLRSRDYLDHSLDTEILARSKLAQLFQDACPRMGPIPGVKGNAFKDCMKHLQDELKRLFYDIQKKRQSQALHVAVKEVLSNVKEAISFGLQAAYYIFKNERIIRST